MWVKSYLAWTFNLCYLRGELVLWDPGCRVSYALRELFLAYHFSFLNRLI
jgi:hypothetical protein